MGRWRQFGVMPLQSKEFLEPPELKEARQDYSSESPKGAQFCPSLDCRLLTSRTMREYISFVCGNFICVCVWGGEPTRREFSHYEKMRRSIILEPKNVQVVILSLRFPVWNKALACSWTKSALEQEVGKASRCKAERREKCLQSQNQKFSNINKALFRDLFISQILHQEKIFSSNQTGSIF